MNGAVAQRLMRIFCGLLVALCVAVKAETNDSVAQRALFLAAEQELRSGAGPRYRALRQQLDDYPLVIYLDYADLRARLTRTTVDDANTWLSHASGSPLENRFREAWIVNHGRRERWRALLDVQTSAPRDARLQCYYYRALLATGRQTEAFVGARALWNVGKSQDKACDPLFNAWFGVEGPGDALIWSRALKAFDARSAQLLRYLTRFASPELEALLQELYKVYRTPRRLMTDTYPPTPRHAQLLTVGLRRLARVNPADALTALERQREKLPLTDQQIQAVERTILRHGLFAKSAPSDAWLAETLDRHRDDELTEIYLRARLAGGDWENVVTATGWLSEARARDDQWQYWRAVALSELGQSEQADELLANLAEKRSFHGFLAADRVGKPYQLNDGGNPVSAAPDADRGIDRVAELMALGRDDQARGEWQALLNRSDRSQKQALSVWADAAGWPRLTLVATNAAGAWDAIAWRFPFLYRSEFVSAATRQNVPYVELLALARRESALDPRAQSSVGALGLMQVMPTTARQVARREGLKYQRHRLLDTSYNIDVGSRYYRQLRERFGGLRPLALAGYNAGPHRAERWQKGSLTVDRWIDSLPFHETREYVRAVMAYALIYRLRAGENASLFSPEEWQHRY